MTAALVTQYGAACDHAVMPGDRRGEDDRARPAAGASAATAAWTAWTAPIRLMSIDPLPVGVGEVVDPAVRGEHAGVADQHVEASEAFDGAGDDRFDLGEIGHVGEHGLDADARRRHAR